MRVLHHWQGPVGGQDWGAASRKFRPLLNAGGYRELLVGTATGSVGRSARPRSDSPLWQDNKAGRFLEPLPLLDGKAALQRDTKTPFRPVSSDCFARL